MALLWPKHGPNMVLLIEYNIDMALVTTSLTPESFTRIAGLES